MEERLICSCGGNWFELKKLMKVQLGSKYVPNECFIPIEQIDIVRCAYCSKIYNKDGQELNLNTLE